MKSILLKDVPDEVHAELKKKAAREDRSMASLLRRILADAAATK